ncbi:MAG: imidazolonepropionase [Actinomycetota bacterium]|nr:imidazolonepropionase [Actinomycetota bacterium]
MTDEASATAQHLSLTLADAASVVPMAGEGPLRGPSMASVDTLSDVSIVCRDGLVESIGGPANADVVFDASGCTVVPGFVDPHTHLPFFGWRADEDAARLSGIRYEDVHSGGGGIFRSARLLRDATDEAVLGFASELAASMLRHGTTTFETKSGYGLSVEAELRQLRLARELAASIPQKVMSTCLAAHAVPEGKSEGEWTAEAAEDLLPAVAAEGLASACDLYVETIAFQHEHAARLAQAAESLGLRMRVHADQLADNQTGAFAARWGFASADHLNHTSLDAVDDLAASETVAVLLPGATFTLRQGKKPPARALIDAGAIVALGSDLNPGTSPIHSMPFVMALACRLYGLRPLEALAAATVNAAFVLGLHDEVGRIVPGRRADLVVLDAASFDAVPYRPDHDAVLAVVCGGRLVYVAPRAEARVARH